MTVYADTGFLCSLYLPDAKTDAAILLLATLKPPLPYTWLHQLELKNAFRLRVFRNDISKTEKDTALERVHADISSGFLERKNIHHEDLVTKAEILSSQYSEPLGTRSLDVLHVAACRLLGIRTFCTFDRRQSQLASQVGLVLVS